MGAFDHLKGAVTRGGNPFSDQPGAPPPALVGRDRHLRRLLTMIEDVAQRAQRRVVVPARPTRARPRRPCWWRPDAKRPTRARSSPGPTWPPTRPKRPRWSWSRCRRRRTFGPRRPGPTRGRTVRGAGRDRAGGPDRQRTGQPDPTGARGRPGLPRSRRPTPAVGGGPGASRDSGCPGPRQPSCGPGRPGCGPGARRPAGRAARRRRGGVLRRAHHRHRAGPAGRR